VPVTSILLLSVSAACAAMAAFVWRRRTAPGGIALMCFLLCVAVWNAGYGLEIVADGVARKLFWAKAEYPGVYLLPVAFFAFSVEHSGRSWAQAGRLAVLSIVPCAIILLAWTNERHHLIWTDIAAFQPAGKVLALGHGAVFYFGALYAYGLILAASVMLLSGRASHRRFYRRQSVVVLVAICTPWIANILYLLGIPSSGFDTTTIAFAVTATAVSLGCIRWGLLDVVPVARDAVVEHMSDGMVVIDLRGRIVDCNRAVAPLLLCPVEDAVGRPAREILPALGAATIRTPDGRRIFEVEDIDLTGRAAAAGRLLLFHDVTAREALQAHLAADALTDDLTGIGNRRYFMERLQWALDEGRRGEHLLAVLYLDLDGFKPINDTYGHASGDEVLVATARRLEQCIRPGDALARLGGDEFAILIPRLDDRDHAGHVADRIALALAEPVQIDRGAVVATASVGVHVAIAGDATPESLLRGADRGMYAAKRGSVAAGIDS
jgi:diguanylate cyclase (GGDEF)-like protein